MKVREIRSQDQILLVTTFLYKGQQLQVQFIGVNEAYLQIGLMRQGTQELVKAHQHSEIARAIPTPRKFLCLVKPSSDTVAPLFFGDLIQ